jgi:hypothetical protein
VLESLTDRQVREMLVDFLVVYCLALELLPHLALQNTVVVYDRLIGVQAMQFTGQGLQQSTAAASGSSKHNTKLARSDNTVEVMENLLALGFAEVLASTERRHRDVADGLLELNCFPGSEDIQIFEHNSELLHLNTFAF